MKNQSNIKPPKVIFFTMEGCGFCMKAKQELEKELKNGLVHLQDAKDAPSGVSGFPHFVNFKSGKSHTGYAPKDKLFESLGVLITENYEPPKSRNRNLDNYAKLSDIWT